MNWYPASLSSRCLVGPSFSMSLHQRPNSMPRKIWSAIRCSRARSGRLVGKLILLPGSVHNSDGRSKPDILYRLRIAASTMGSRYQKTLSLGPKLRVSRHATCQCSPWIGNADATVGGHKTAAGIPHGISMSNSGDQVAAKCTQHNSDWGKWSSSSQPHHWNKTVCTVQTHDQAWRMDTSSSAQADSCCPLRLLPIPIL